MTVRPLLRCLLALAAITPVAAAAAGPAHAVRVGAVTDLSWGISEAEATRTIELLQSTDVRTVRMNVNWKEVEAAAKGQMDAAALARTDRLVDRLARAGIEILMPISDGVPYWASADPAKRADGGTPTWNGLYRPSDPRDYADFAAYVARRYAPRGVHLFEVWNEPNHPRFWPSGPNAAEYAALLKAAYPAIKAADPSATVVLGGLSKSDAAYLDALYAAGAKGSFDVAAVHPYVGAVDPTWCWTQAGTATLSPDAFCALEEVRSVMQRRGDGSTPLWLTEFGWSTSTDAAYSVTEDQQAAYLTAATDKLRHSYPWVQRAYWYGLRNVPWLRDDPRDLEAGYGVVRTDFSPKPALRALRAAVAGGEPAAPGTTAPAPPPATPPSTARTAPPTPGAPPAAPPASSSEAPAPAPVVTVPPTSYTVIAGTRVKRRGGVRRLTRKDGRTVEVRATGRRTTRAGVEVRTRLTAASRRRAAAVSVLVDATTSARAALRLEVYDVARRRWRRTAPGATLRPARNLLTAAGDVRVRVATSYRRTPGRGAVRLRADRVRLRVSLAG